jgi:hypothetical protein
MQGLKGERSILFVFFFIYGIKSMYVAKKVHIFKVKKNTLLTLFFKNSLIISCFTIKH